MPSTHDTFFADQALPLLFELQADTITHTPAGGAGAALSALIGKESIVEVENTSAGTRTKKYTRSVTVEDTAAARQINATVTVGSTAYQVDGVAEAEAGFITLSLVRAAAMEKARKQFRGGR